MPTLPQEIEAHWQRLGLSARLLPPVVGRLYQEHHIEWDSPTTFSQLECALAQDAAFCQCRLIITRVSRSALLQIPLPHGIPLSWSELPCPETPDQLILGRDFAGEVLTHSFARQAHLLIAAPPPGYVEALLRQAQGWNWCIARVTLDLQGQMQIDGESDEATPRLLFLDLVAPLSPEHSAGLEAGLRPLLGRLTDCRIATSQAIHQASQDLPDELRQDFLERLVSLIPWMRRSDALLIAVQQPKKGHPSAGLALQCSRFVGFKTPDGLSSLHGLGTSGAEKLLGLGDALECCGARALVEFSDAFEGLGLRTLRRFQAGSDA